MIVIWLNGTVGAGKTAVGRALASMLPNAIFLDGDDHAGSPVPPDVMRWRRALDAVLTAIRKQGRLSVVVVAYPLERSGYARVRALCLRSGHGLFVINLVAPLQVILRNRRARLLSISECARVRVMWSEGYHRRPFADVTVPNVRQPERHTAMLIARRTIQR